MENKQRQIFHCIIPASELKCLIRIIILFLPCINANNFISRFFKTDYLVRMLLWENLNTYRN
jgi:hypothetical protein